MPQQPGQSDRRLDAIILAAGKGTRMDSDLAKVLHPVADRPMIHWVVDACEMVGCQRIVIVVGHQADAVKHELAHRPQCEFVEQNPQHGTGHAVMVAEALFAEADRADTDVLVLCGDGPLIRRETLRTLIDTHREQNAGATLATAVLDDPSGYGRIVRDAAGDFECIVEDKDASEDERAICEINPSYYCFRAADLFAALGRISNDNAKGEYYLTDVLEVIRRDGRPVAVVDAVPAEDVLSINTPQHLAEVDAILRRRLGMEVQA